MSGRICGTCAHWEHPRTDFAQTVYATPPDYTRAEGEETLPQWVRDHYEKASQADRLFGDCRGVEMGPANVGEPLPLALVLDGSGYKADLFTRAEFSCALWKRREPTSTPSDTKP